MSNDQTSNDLERVKHALKERFSPADYEGLIEYAAELYISNWKRKREMDNFHQAILNLEFAKADENKDAEKWVKEKFKNNSLFDAFIHLDFYTGAAGRFRSWKMNGNKHKNNRMAKALVLGWWKDDERKYRNKTDVVNDYLTKLKELKLYPKPNKDYDYETVYTWLTSK